MYFDLIEETFWGGHMLDILRRLDHDFLCEDGPKFEKTNDGYSLTIAMDSYSAENVKIHLDYDNLLCVDSVYRTSNSTKAYSYNETIPEDADPQTIKATYDNDLKSLVISLEPIKKTQTSREIPVQKVETAKQKNKDLHNYNKTRGENPLL